jgi:hypothetical protein
MKLMHTTTTTLNTKEFNKVSDKIIDALFGLDPNIQNLYDIHINFVEDNWRVDFLPVLDNIPVIKVDTYTDYDNNGNEILHIIPSNLTDFPNTLKFKGDDNSYDLCMNYVSIFEFVLGMYDFEYNLH